MNSIHNTVSSHVKQVIDNNFELCDKIHNAQKILKGIVSVEALAGTDYFTSFAASKQEAVFSHHSFKHINFAHEILLLLCFPFVAKNYVQKSFTQIKKSFSTQLPYAVKQYNFAKGVRSLSLSIYYFADTLRLAAHHIAQIKHNPAIEKPILEVASKLSYLSKGYAVQDIFIPYFAIKHISSLGHLPLDRSSPIPDQEILEECFGIDQEHFKVYKLFVPENHERFVNQIDVYKRMKMIRMASAIASFASITVLGGSIAPIVAMGALIAKLGSEFWLSRKVQQFRAGLQLQDKSNPVQKVTSLVSMAATPFLMMPGTSAIAGIAIIGAVATDIITSRYYK